MKIFFSYHFPNEGFVQQVSGFVRRQSNAEEVFCFGDRPGTTPFKGPIEKAIRTSDAFVLFHGPKIGAEQGNEVQMASACRPLPHLLRVVLPRAGSTVGLAKLGSCRQIRVVSLAEADAERCAQTVAKHLELVWKPFLGVRDGYPFQYEKDIIKEFIEGDGRLSRERIENGCPECWPEVRRRRDNADNPLLPELIGDYRDPEARILVDARAHYGSRPVASRRSRGLDGPLAFPEAGPRKRIAVPQEGGALRIGIVVSGGIAPGINAVIAGMVERHHLYAQGAKYALHAVGYGEGFKGLLRPGTKPKNLTPEMVRETANRGGSLLTTSRADELLGVPLTTRVEKFERIVSRLSDQGIDILYVIGGDGSMRAAHAISCIAQSQHPGLCVVAIPKTMDNDILWVWQSFGFLSAVETAKRFIVQLYTEAQSNPRLGVVQLFGSDSGFVVSHAALASGVCDLALVPEVPFDMPSVARYVVQRLDERYKHGGDSPYGIVVMAETAIPVDVEHHINDRVMRLDRREKEAIQTFLRDGRRVSGQTPDALRSGGLKVVSRYLERAIRQHGDAYWRDFRVFTSEPRHLLRSLEPSASDVVFGQRLGCLAVDNAMAGFTDFMVSQWLTEFVLVPLELVGLGRKRVPPNGIFWKSVLAATGARMSDYRLDGADDVRQTRVRHPKRRAQ